MRQQPVNWFEGMFLRPQHFQASDRYWQDSLSLATRWQTHYAYGLRSFEYQRESLSAYFFQLNSCEAILRDGTLVKIDDNLRISLREALQNSADVTVYLAVSKLILGRPNLGDESYAERRSTTVSIEVPDENYGGSETEIVYKSLHVRLMLSTDNLEGYEILPIAKVKRVGTDEASPELDSDYFPALLAVDAWNDLAQDCIRSVYDLVTQKVDVLSERATQRNLAFNSQEPGELDDLWMLGQLNQGLATLHAITFATGIHPFTAYLELCRLVGMISIFDAATRRLDPQLPAYDHDDLGRIFRWLQRRIGELIGTAKRLEYEQRYFIGVDRGMQVALDPKWLHPSWKWYIGVHGENVSNDVIRDLLREGAMDWKMGSVQQVDLLFKHRMPDVKADDELRTPPRALPSQRGWLYYEVRREGPAWKDVLATQSLAMRFNTNVIGNLDRLPNQRRLEVMYRDKRAILEFALFAVPITNA